MEKITNINQMIPGQYVLDGCMITYTGKVIDLFNPDPDLLDIEDIAHGLANNCRWNGHTKSFWSVAQHSCMMYDLASKDKKLTYLMHDSEEAYWGDMIKPLKNMLRKLCPEIPILMEDLRKMIFNKWDIKYIDDLTHKDDLYCLAWEFDSIIKNDWAYYMIPEKAEQEFLNRFYDSI